jgi:hypothetical protein
MGASPAHPCALQILLVRLAKVHKIRPRLPLTKWVQMGNSRNAVMSRPVNRDRWSEEAEEPAQTYSRVFPVAPVSTWLSDADSAQPVTPPALELSEPGENHFWDSPPRDSVTHLQSIAPVPAGPVRSPWRLWAARLLFATIFCGTVALLALELKALATQASAPLSAHSSERASAVTAKASALRQ